jgi:multidrug efflux pump subunit AcrB
MVANVLTAAILVLGLYAISSLPLAELPRVDLGKADIVTQYPGASAEDVEANVTSRIEKELLTLSDIKKFSSVSEEGQSEISIELKSDINDVAKSYQDIRDAVARVSDLPAGVTQLPSVRTKKSSSLDFMVVGISGDMPYAELRQHARALEVSLRRLPGIGEVISKDMRAREFWIQLEPEQLERYGFTITEVASLIQQRNVLMTGGSLESYKTAQDVLTLSEIKDIEGLQNIILSSQPLLKLEDLAEDIISGFERPQSYANINGHHVIAFDLRTSDSADVIKTAADVRNLLSQYGENIKEVELVVGFDLSDEIQSKFDIVKNNGLVGLILVILTLALMLNRNVSIWVALSIPFSLLGVIALLPALGQVLDGYTLAAMILIIGIIVDDAVVVSEKIVQRFEAGEELNSAIIEGIKEVMPAVFTSLLTTFLAFLPLMFLPGNSGKMLYVMPLTIGLALLFSFIDVILVLPSHLRSVLAGRREQLLKEEKNSRLMQAVSVKFKVLLTGFVKQRYKTVPAMFIVILSVGIWAFTQLPYTFFPTGGAYIIEIETEVASSANIDDARRLNKQLEDIIAADKDNVVRWYSDIGAPYSSFLVSLKPAKERDLNAEQVLQSWQQAVEELEGFVDIELEVDAGGPPKGRPVDLNVVGGDDAMRDKMATDIKDWLEQQPGVHRVNRASTEMKSIISVDIDYDLIAAYGISTFDIARTLRLSIDGERISRVFAGDEEVHYRLLLESNDRELSELEQLTVRAANGQLIQLRELVNWSQSEAPAAIKHYNGERSIRVSASIESSVTDPIAVDDAMRAYFSSKDYSGVRFVSSGQAKETREALNGLTMAMGIALIAIMLTMILLFDSIWRSVLVLLIVPLGVAACALVLFVHNEPLSFFAIVGSIGLVGVMVNNCLVLMCHYQKQSIDAVKDVDDFVISGAMIRFRAVLLTTLTTVAGLIPLAYGWGGYDNYMGPIALVMGWGIVFSSIITLLVLPSLYAFVMDWRKK